MTATSSATDHAIIRIIKNKRILANIIHDYAVLAKSLPHIRRPIPHWNRTTMTRRLLLASCLSMWVTALAAADPLVLTVQADQGKAISPDLFGIFFEDLNYAADGGLYAELVENRSFEYAAEATPRKLKDKWNALTSWELVQRDGSKGAITIDTKEPLNAANPHYAVLTVEHPGVGLANDSFDNLIVKAGATYDVSLFARQISGDAKPIQVRLETADGTVLARTELAAPNAAWAKSAATLMPSADAQHARLVVLAGGPGQLALDMVSLFPRATFKNRPNGLRADLAQVIADLKPKFVRFPGGCLVHASDFGIYHWKESIGPVETRKAQSNSWRYHQTKGLGYFEYFQFCEDISATPLPVLPAGVTCQFPKIHQQATPMERMPEVVQDTLDLIEYANGPVTSTWGAKRAAAGHPEPFHLKYLGLGNEEAITPAFRERFALIAAAVKAKHPEITVIGTVGAFPDGKDFDAGWAFAREQRIAMVDEHYYMSPQWFFDHLNRYDAYPRTVGVYLGEYAAHEKKEADGLRRNTWRSALAEATYLTQLERNGDVVRLSSYAPLLAKYDHFNWTPDLIYFDDARVVKSVNYHVQQMFSANAGTTWLPIVPTGTAPKTSELAYSAVKDATTGDLVVKLVNTTTTPYAVNLAFAGFTPVGATAALTVIADNDPLRENTPDKAPLEPTSRTIPVGATTAYEIPAQSLSVLRFASKR
jgi:alpha-L-arabinofuranosidase